MKTMVRTSVPESDGQYRLLADERYYILFVDEEDMKMKQVARRRLGTRQSQRQRALVNEVLVHARRLERAYVVNLGRPMMNSISATRL